MIRSIRLNELLGLHHMMIDAIGGSHGVRDQGAAESALAQPFMTFAGEDLYPTLSDKAAALGFSLISNHPFIDGNKRVGHAAMQSFLRLNRHDLVGEIDEQEKTILAVAAGEMGREEFTKWIQAHVRSLSAVRRNIQCQLTTAKFLVRFIIVNQMGCCLIVSASASSYYWPRQYMRSKHRQKKSQKYWRQRNKR